MTDDQPSTVQRPGPVGKSSVVTLERLQKIARFLNPLKWLSLLGFAIFVITFTLSIIGASLDRYVIPSVIGGMWTMLLFAFITGFQVIPDHAPPGGSITERMTAQMARAAYWLLAVLTGAASLGALLLTFRLLVIWSTGNGA